MMFSLSLQKYLLAFLAPLALLAAATVAGGGGKVPGVDPRINDRIIVHLLDDVALEDFITAFEADHPTVGLDLDESIPGRPVHFLAVDLPPGAGEDLLDLLEDALETGYPQFLKSGDWLYENQAPEGKSGSTWLDTVSSGHFGTQYARDLLGLDAAHARSQGQGTVVAVVDSGVDMAHPRLAGRIVSGGWDFIDDDSDPSDTGDGEDNDGDGLIDEMTGHGTFVAGLISLVAPQAGILPIRTLNSDGVGHEWKLVQGIYFAIDRQVDVINLSLGSTYDTDAVKGALSEAVKQGIVIVASAGNFDRPEPREFPAMDDLDDPDVEGALGVAALDHLDVKAEFSNFSRRLFISAPGDAAEGPVDPQLSIVSTLPGGEYAAWEGTSFANAFVSGTAALIRAQHPEWPRDLSTYNNVLTVLALTAEDVYDVNPAYAEDEELGVGRVDTEAAAAAGPVAPQLGDLDGDGMIGFGDLLSLLSAWGPCPAPPLTCHADLDGDVTVGFGDLLILLAAWG